VTPQHARAGALLRFANSVAVAAIGVLASRVLKPHNDTAGQAYLVARTALSVPGGLFEVTFGALLLARGLPGNGATDDRPRLVSPATR
jgi:hypothetical protein